MAINPFRKGGNDTIPVDEGGTGATDAASALSNLGGLDATSHASVDHTGIPGVGSGDLTTAAHATIDHSAITGNARAMAALPFGGDWGGGTDQYLTVNGRPGAGTTSTSSEQTRAYMPFPGEIIAVTWNSANSVTRGMRVYLNGSPASGFLFSLNNPHYLAPTPVAFTAGSYIEVFGDSTVGTADPSQVSVHVWVRSYLP